MDHIFLEKRQIGNDGLQVRYCSDNISSSIDDDEQDEEVGSVGDETNNEAPNNRSCYDNVSGNKLLSSFNENAADMAVRPSFARFRSASMHRHSSFAKKKVYENSYRMEPMPDQYFIWWKVRNIVQKIMGHVFDDFHYDAKAGASMCKLMGNKIIVALKRKFDWPRYRYVCHVTLAQLKDQGLIIADRSLWTANIDNCAVCVFKNKTAVGIVTVHGIYME